MDKDTPQASMAKSTEKNILEAPNQSKQFAAGVAYGMIDGAVNALMTIIGQQRTAEFLFLVTDRVMLEGRQNTEAPKSSKPKVKKFWLFFFAGVVYGALGMRMIMAFFP